MRIIVSAGGTGGHIYPAIALINKIKELEPNSEILYIGTHNRMEKDIIPKFDINYLPIEVTGLKRKLTFENVKSIVQFFKSISIAKHAIEDFDPDVVVGFGGYVTAPVITAARRLGIPTFIHEQNSVSGLANKLLSKFATSIGVSLEVSLRDYGKKAFLSGNPCSESAYYKKPTKEVIFKKERPLVIMVNGSLGSASVDRVIKQVLPLLKDKPYNFLYVSGKNNFDSFKDLKLPPNVLIKPYLDDAVGYLKKANLFISRAGATTISEISVIGVPTIFIPSPYVVNNHQYLNAKTLVDQEAALMLEEKNLTPTKLIFMIDDVLSNGALLTKLSRNLKKTGIKDSATRIYHKLQEIKK